MNNTASKVKNFDSNYRPNTKKRNFSVETIKGLFWYDDVEHLRSRIIHETRWLEKLAMKNDMQGVIKQSKFISQIINELLRVTK